MGYFLKYRRCLIRSEHQANSLRRVRFRVNFTLISVAWSIDPEDFTSLIKPMGAVAQPGEVKVRDSPCPTFLASLTKFLATAVISLHNRYLSIYLNSAPERQAMKMLSQRMIHSRACLVTGSIHPMPCNFY